jgi:hypothetical protein
MGVCGSKKKVKKIIIGIDATSRIMETPIRNHSEEFLSWAASTYSHKNLSDLQMRDNKFKCERIIWMIKNVYSKPKPEFNQRPPKFEDINNTQSEEIHRTDYEKFVLECIDYVSCFVVDSVY